MAWNEITDYDLSSFTGFQSFLVENTLGIFSIMLMIAVFLLFSFFYWLSQRDIIGSFAVGGFGLFVASLLLYMGGWITGVIFIFAFAVSILTWLGLFIPRN